MSEKVADSSIMEGDFTIENSMFAKFLTSKQKYIGWALSVWLADARCDFETIQALVYELCFVKSINEIELAKMELRELNKFFETGKCNSVAIHIDERVFADNFTEKELYEYYLSLLRGRYEFFITVEAVQASLSPKKKGFILGRTVKKPTENKQWQLAARIQGLLWATAYLKNLIKTENFPKTSRSTDDLAEKATKKFFNVPNSDKVIPALYKALVDKELIEETTEEKFKDAFLNGNGFIKWLDGSKKQPGTKSLIYLIAKLSNANIIKDGDFIKITASMFKDKNEKLYSHGSLTQSSSKTDVEPPKKARDIDIIVDKLKNL